MISCRPSPVGNVAGARQRIVAGLAQRLRVQLGLARLRVAKPPFANGRQSFGTIQPRVALFPQPLVGDAVEPRVPARERGAQHRLVALEQPRLGASQRRGQPAEQLGVRHRLAARRDRRTIHRQIEMAPRRRQIEMLDLARRRQHVVGVARGFGDEQVVDDGEQILAQQPFTNPALIRHRHHRVGAVDDERANRRRQAAAAEIAADVAHVQHAHAGLVDLRHLARGPSPGRRSAARAWSVPGRRRDASTLR